MDEKCEYQTWGDTREMYLSQALAPDVSDYSGQIENTQAAAEKALEAVGRILAHLVLKGLMMLKEAEQISGVYGTITLKQLQCETK